MKVELFSETSVNFYQAIRRYAQKSKNLLKENYSNCRSGTLKKGSVETVKQITLTNAACGYTKCVKHIQGITLKGTFHEPQEKKR